MKNYRYSIKNSCYVVLALRKMKSGELGWPKSSGLTLKISRFSQQGKQK